ncbi:MAG: diguanylate cyclase [Proteobacteria bacterium]|nr:diguanylate cyclase [Pseudomonadota bacterium]MBU1060483.1 diguanylate cyclase [Pseudomonadota bacterium]
MIPEHQDVNSSQKNRSKKLAAFRFFVHEALTSCHPRQWTLKTRILYLPGFLIILFVILLLFYLNQAFTVQARHSARSQLSLLSQWINNDIAEHRKNIMTESLFIADQPDLAAALANEDLKKLDSLLLSDMKKSLQHASHHQNFFYHFYKPPAISFYQHSKLNLGGEDLSQAKPLVVKVNHELQPYSGFEHDANGVSIIAISPVFFNDNHVGAVEVRMSLEHAFEHIEIAEPFGLLLVEDSGKTTPVTEQDRTPDNLNILLSKGHINSKMISQKLSFRSATLESGKFLHKSIELDGGVNSPLAKIYLIYDASSGVGIYNKDVFSFLLVLGSVLLILILYSNLMHIGSFLSLLKKILIGSFSNDFVKRFESDHIHCLHVLNCKHEECPVHQNPSLVCYLETGSLAISPKWRGTCIFLNKYKDCVHCPVYGRRIRDELTEMRNVVNTIMHLWSDFLDKIQTLLADADVLRSFTYQHKKLSLDNVSTFLEQMEKVTVFGRDLQGARNEEEVYKQLSFIFEREFSIDYYLLLGVNKKDSTMKVLMDNRNTEPLCIKEVNLNAEFCRAQRLGEVVYSYNNQMLCPYFNINHNEYHRYCLPMVMGGSVGVVFSFMAPKEQLEVRKKQIMLMRKYLDASAPVLNSLRLLALLKKQTLKDPLTRCYNRRFLDDYVKQYEPLAKRNRSEIGLFMLDIDYFKLVNDTFGHPAGDKILQDIAAIIREQIRASDLLVRYGGEEFLVILLEMKDTISSENMAEKIRLAIEQYHFTLPDGAVIQKTVSIGVADFPKDADSIKQTIKFADVALYEAKKSGRNKTILFKQEMWKE